MPQISDVAVIIATYNRAQHLAQVIDALGKQSVLPAIVAIADSSDEEDCLTNQLSVSRSRINIRHLNSTVKSLTQQKNMALNAILSHPGIRFVQVLDDDTIPDSNHLEILRNTLLNHPDTVGVSGITIPKWEKPNTPALIRAAFRLCGLDSLVCGRVTAAGIGIPVDTSLQKAQESQWLYGCSMWRRDIFLQHQYAPDFLGSGLFEDVEFSTRVRHLGKLLVNPSAVLIHRMAESGRPEDFLYAYRFVRNRRRVIHNLQTKRSLLLFPLSIILQAAVYATKRKRRRNLLKGTVQAIIDDFRGKPLR